jgi:dipeptidyl aminopeptidase/acylaminoacyl peptidase
VSKDDPPFLIVHGTADNTVPFERAEMFYAALRKAEVDVKLVKILGGGHGIGGDKVMQRVNVFFDKHLRGQDVQVSDDADWGGPGE